MLDREHSVRFEGFAPLRSRMFERWSLQSGTSAGISGKGVLLEPLVPGDLAVAQAMSKGKFHFAGVTVTGLPHDLFSLQPPSTSWLQSLHDLKWLNHFVASGQELHRIVARMLVEKWSKSYRHGLAGAVHSQALISLSQAAPFLMGTNALYETVVARIAESHIRRVLKLRPATLSERLLQAFSLHYASLAFRTSPKFSDDAESRVEGLINKVILPDGGHVSRNPSQLFETLELILPLRQGFQRRHLPVPAALSSAIDRMLPMLRMLSHGDHTLANFQGAASPGAAALKTIFESDKTHGRPLLLAPHSGFCRLAHRSSQLIVDVGTPARYMSPLAIEFSDGPHRIFSNCGMPVSASAAWQQAASQLAAHNSLEVDELPIGLHHALAAEVMNSPRGSLARCRHEMTGKSAAITHQRDLFLSHDGRDLRGEDTLSGTAQAFTLRFHLHPLVKATSIRNADKFVLVLPNRTAWTFASRGGAVSLEDSVFLSEAAGPRKTMQIVIRSAASPNTSVKWALRRVEKPSLAGAENGSSPPLPF